MHLSAWTFISDKTSHDALYQGRCYRTYNFDKDPGMERRMKARSCLWTASLLKHNDIVDTKLSLLNCDILSPQVLQYFWADIFIFQQVIGTKLLLFLD